MPFFIFEKFKFYVQSHISLHVTSPSRLIKLHTWAAFFTYNIDISKDMCSPIILIHSDRIDTLNSYFDNNHFKI